MLLRPIIEEALILLDATDIVETELLLEDGLLEADTGDELLGHFPLEYPLPDLR